MKGKASNEKGRDGKGRGQVMCVGGREWGG